MEAADSYETLISVYQATSSDYFKPEKLGSRFL
jgi:hypothetical protein